LKRMVGACIYGWHDGVFGDIHSWFAGDLIRWRTHRG
jgi:hypothetical protein